MISRAERQHQRVNALLSSGTMDDPRAYLGLGNEPIPGKPFGYANAMERQAIREHLVRDPSRFTDQFAEFRIEQRISAIQQRLHRERPNLRERQAAWKARQPVVAKTGVDAFFNWEELQHLVDMFAMANDPVGAEIARKAAAALEKMA